MSIPKDQLETPFRSKQIKKSSEKRNRSVMAPPCTVISNNCRENLSHQQSDEQIFPNKSAAYQKEQLFEAIQSHEKEIEFLNKVLLQFLDMNELMKIKQNSQYDENSHTWVLPTFVVQQRKTVFPKLQRSQMRETIQNELKQKKFIMKLSPTPDFACPNYGEEEWNKKQQITNFTSEIENRPATSLSKQRKRSSGARILEGECEFKKNSKKKPAVKGLMYGFYE